MVLEVGGCDEVREPGGVGLIIKRATNARDHPILENLPLVGPEPVGPGDISGRDRVEQSMRARVFYGHVNTFVVAVVAECLIV